MDTLIKSIFVFGLHIPLFLYGYAAAALHHCLRCLCIRASHAILHSQDHADQSVMFGFQGG